MKYRYMIDQYFISVQYQFNENFECFIKYANIAEFDRFQVETLVN